jgi:hypothetical protein
MALADSGTLLVLLNIGVPFYSARGLTQTLTPIQAIRNNKNNLRRTIGGTLLDLTPPQFLKYGSRISATDVAPPAINGVFPGTTITVECVAELAYAVGGSPTRPEVSGSSVTANGFVFYRPVLAMMVVDLSESFAEWQGENNWFIDLEEV